MNTSLRSADSASGAHNPQQGAVQGAVQCAAAALRRGGGVRLVAPASSAWLVAAEAYDPDGPAAPIGAPAGPPVLLIAPRRAAALLGTAPPPGDPSSGGVSIVAFTLAPAAFDPALLRMLADPTVPPWPAATLRPLLIATAQPAMAAAAIALVKLAGLLPAAVLVPAGPDQPGPAVPRPPAIDVAAIADYPHRLNAGLRRVADAAVPMDGAPDARVIAFRSPDGGPEHLAIVVGQPHAQAAPLVRVHSACLTGDLLGSLRCDCGPQLRGALARMHAAGGGILLYLAQEGRGIGLVNKLRAYAIQDRGEDTVDANLSLGFAVDERSFAVAATMLDQLGIGRVRLLTNNPAKLAALAACGIVVAGREPHVMAPNGVNDAYLRAKATRLGHLPA